MSRRVRSEVQLWRMTWQQVETLLDRVQEAREDDRPDAVRCKALYDAATVIENIRLRREGRWMPHPLEMGIERTASVTVKATYSDRKFDLPGPLELEMAAAGLKGDDEGKPEKDPPKVRLFASQSLFEIWDPETQSFQDLAAPAYIMGRLNYDEKGPALPNWPTAFQQMYAIKPIDIEIGADSSSDDSMFSFPRREVAAEESIAFMKPWSELRQQRADAATDADWELLAEGQPDFTEMVDLVQSEQWGKARSRILKARIRAKKDVQRLERAIELLEAEDDEDEAIAPIEELLELVKAEKAALVAARQLILGSVLSQEKQQALNKLNGLFPLEALIPSQALIYSYLDQAIETRIAYPDGSLRCIRALEFGLLKQWRSRAPWFDLRRERVLERRMGRYIRTFEANLRALVQTQQTTLASGLVGAAVGSSGATSGVDALPLDGDPDVDGLRAGQIAVIGGARPAIAVILGRERGQSRVRLRVLPLKISQVSGLGYDGIPGMVEGGVSLTNTLTTPVTGAELVRGKREGEREADGIPQQIVGLWSSLKLLRGAHFDLDLPAPFTKDLELPVHATEDQPLARHATRLLIPTDLHEDGEPLFGVPGEIFLLRGRDAEGQWWQGAIEVRSAVVTTMEAEQADPVQDPTSPLCCEPETPIVMLVLERNSMPADLVGHVEISRRFLGFGWPGLVVGQQLPRRVDPDSKLVQMTPMAGGFRPDVLGTAELPSSPLLDRGAELEAAAFLLDQWLGRG